MSDRVRGALRETVRAAARITPTGEDAALTQLAGVAAENEWVRCCVWRPADFDDVRAVLAR